MIGGFVLGLIVAIADVYFLMKRLMAIDQPKVVKKEKFPAKKVSTIQTSEELSENKNVIEKKND
jgi:hypothetical protein